MNDALLDSMRQAVELAPNDLVLRLHFSRMLLDAGRADDAIACASGILRDDPANVGARELMVTALALPTIVTTTDSVDRTLEHAATSGPLPERSTSAGSPAIRPSDTGFDWSAAEQEIAPSPFRIESSTVHLSDVGGMTEVKERLDAAFLAPLRNPKLRQLYGKSLRGGLLMYGPPGCGKTYIAKAVAGELQAKFLSVGLADVLDPMLGVSEQNVHEIFQLARRSAPCVVFFDEVDALAARRTSASSPLRGTINQLLTELDGVADDNEGVFVLAATNRPWDLDPALRRPGRIDRTVLVLPPDRVAREAILSGHLADRPVEGADVAALAQRTDGFSGADLAYLCEAASERALMDSVRSGVPRRITMKDLVGALGGIRPSTSGWLDSARNVVLFGDDDGTYADLRTYLKKAKRL